MHHTVDPDGAVREIVRAVKPGGHVLIYVYEDFERRGLPWQLALTVVNAIRRPISKMSPTGIRRVCAILAPLSYSPPARCRRGIFRGRRDFPIPPRRTQR